MIKSKLGNNNFLIFIAGLFFILAVIFHQKKARPQFDIEMQDRALNINKDLLRIFSVGNKRTIASTLWVQTLMESDTGHYNRNDRKNWMYLRFDTIASLDPFFYQNYLWGGTYLSIIKNDMEGAADIFEKGLEFYPNDYELNFRQGFNYYFELGDFKKGLSYLERISDHPKTSLMTKLIINKLKFETSNNYDLALNFLSNIIQQEKDPTLLKKLRSDFYSLKAQRDLECLNGQQTHCDQYDSEGNRYFLEDGTWKARLDFRPYKIHLRQKEEKESAIP